MHTSELLPAFVEVHQNFLVEHDLHGPDARTAVGCPQIHFSGILAFKKLREFSWNLCEEAERFIYIRSFGHDDDHMDTRYIHVPSWPKGFMDGDEELEVFVYRQ
jgi:hypothetical protein